MIHDAFLNNRLHNIHLPFSAGLKTVTVREGGREGGRKGMRERRERSKLVIF